MTATVQRRSTSTRRAAPAGDSRKADLAKIHLAKKALAWDDDTYRDILMSVCAVRSSAELDAAGRRLFLEHLQRCGWKPAGGDRGERGDRPVRKPLTAPQKKIWALWQQLADAGLVDNRRMPAVLAYVQRQTHVDRLEWLTPAQENLVIESLKLWLERAPKAPGGAA